MNNMYESEPYNSSSELFMAIAERERDALLAITRLDEYMHFREQLEQMRARGGEFNLARFALEIAVYSVLMDYEESLGLPTRDIPKPDGKGGIEPETVVPEEWKANSP
ncbi:hypothetical protein [uncultured Roseovarius sp.]|uniref:hypothetical protein n=1 Tax=uncultured Roseovarius sp. TaxID=293344 RepID=UPI00260AA11C|nr:hypothetical protein [uncultured Roseovarius sp.]